MIVAERVYQYPHQGSQVHLVVYETPGGTSHVEGMPDEPGYLVTEEWRAVAKVVKTLGFHPDRAAALAHLEARARELELQRYQPVAPAA